MPIQSHSRARWFLSAIALVGIACRDPGPDSPVRVTIDVPGSEVAVGVSGDDGWVEVRGRVSGGRSLDGLSYQVDGGSETAVQLDPAPNPEGRFAVAVPGLPLGTHTVVFRARAIDGAIDVTDAITVRVVPAIREVPIPSAAGPSFPTSINVSGAVTGYSLDAELPAFHGFVYANDNLTTFEQAAWRSMAGSINDHGDVAGYFVGVKDGPPEARIWTGTGASSPLQQPGVAVAINNDGVVTGAVFVDEGPPRGFVRRNDVVTTFGAASRSTGGASVNASGDVVGTSVGQTDVFGFLFSNASLSPIPTLGGLQAYARDINASGVIVGYSEPTDRSTYRAFRARGNEVLPLRRADLADVASYAYQLNDRNVVVGEYVTVVDGQPQHWAFVSVDDELIAIEDILGPATPPMLGAYALNAAGEIMVAAITPDGIRPLIVALPGGPEARRQQTSLAGVAGRASPHASTIPEQLNGHRERTRP